jgi:peroxiredoxin
VAFTLQIGQPAPDLHLPGVDGKDYSLADFAQAKVLVVDRKSTRLNSSH